MTVRAIAILETMWGSETIQEAARFFRISRDNFSGRRLYALLNGIDARLLVTNACREIVTKPTEHGKPDPVWLAANLEQLDSYGPIQLLLVCGVVAQKTYRVCGYIPKAAAVIEIPHPAARAYWTMETIGITQINIKNAMRQTQGDQAVI